MDIVILHVFSHFELTKKRSRRYPVKTITDADYADDIAILANTPNQAMHNMDSNKTAGEEARRQLHKNAASNLEQVLAATPHKTPTVRPPASYHENYSSKTNQTCRTLLEKQGRTHKWWTLMDPHTWPSKGRTTSTNIHSATMWGYGM